MTILAHLLVAATLPWLTVGVVHRTKALWSGRRGPPLLQSLSDVVRLARKRSVYSTTTTWVFRVTPYVGLVTAVASLAVVPMAGVPAPLSFPLDFVFLAYLWGVGRAALMLGALDTGSAFEGMGASREATFATLVEPAWFLVIGALAAGRGASSLAGALAAPLDRPADVVLWLCALAALLVVVQAENARLPVDDPATHLELTMIHEAMVLDHSGPDLAAIQAAAAVKLAVGNALIATMLNPFTGGRVAHAVGAQVVLSLALAVGVGTVESLMARFKLVTLPRYLLAAVLVAAVGLLATTWPEGVP